MNEDQARRSADDTSTRLRAMVAVYSAAWTEADVAYYCDETWPANKRATLDRLMDLRHATELVLNALSIYVAYGIAPSTRIPTLVATLREKALADRVVDCVQGFLQLPEWRKRDIPLPSLDGLPPYDVPLDSSVKETLP